MYQTEAVAKEITILPIDRRRFDVVPRVYKDDDSEVWKYLYYIIYYLPTRSCCHRASVGFK